MCRLQQNSDFIISEDFIEGSMSLGNRDRNCPLDILFLKLCFSLISNFLIKIKLKIDIFKNINWNAKLFEKNK